MEAEEAAQRDKRASSKRPKSSSSRAASPMGDGSEKMKKEKKDKDKRDKTSTAVGQRPTARPRHVDDVPLSGRALADADGGNGEGAPSMSAARAGLAELLADAFKMPSPASSTTPQAQQRSVGIGGQDRTHPVVGATSTPPPAISVLAAAPTGEGGVAKKAEAPMAVRYTNSTPFTDRSTVPLSGYAHGGGAGGDIGTDRFDEPSRRYDSQPHPLPLAAASAGPTFGGPALPVPVAAPLRDLPIGGLVVPNYSLHQLAAEQQRAAEGLTAQLYAIGVVPEARLSAALPPFFWRISARQSAAHTIKLIIKHTHTQQRNASTRARTH